MFQMYGLKWIAYKSQTTARIHTKEVKAGHDKHQFHVLEVSSFPLWSQPLIFTFLILNLQVSTHLSTILSHFKMLFLSFLSLTYGVCSKWTII